MSTSVSFPQLHRVADPMPSTSALGAHLTHNGLEVNVFAAHAELVELCLIAPPAEQGGVWAQERVPMVRLESGIWHATVRGVGAGQEYGFRVHGPWDPASGHRHNPHKLLVDPYARGIVGEMTYGPQTCGQETTPGRDAEPDAPMSELDSLGYVPRSVVVDSPFKPHDVDRPRTPWSRTVIYEAHVRGLTMGLPGLPAQLRGTYAGLAHPITISYLRSLGVTAVELLPIQATADEPHLARAQPPLTNYWGYNTLGFFTPNPRYAMASSRAKGPGAVLDEVKGMVQLLHEAEIEVICDVVYNHTCEGGPQSLHVSWRGLDNLSYYLHDGAHPVNQVDVTGCGNTLDFRNPRVIQMTLDSLRFWAEDVGVDGFRFDLAVALGRDRNGFRPDHPFLVALQTDPVLNSRKLIAEPWDLGPGGWRTGQFPDPFSEWNDRFRNSTRSFWLSDPQAASHGQPGHGVRELATRLSGSVDLFGTSRPPLTRGTRAAINYVTAHDGFTMADLTTYNHKHNEANGEDNRDGTNDNRSWNHGLEGRINPDGVPVNAEHVPAGTDGPAIRQARLRTHRNLLATLLLSAGTPMITAGDEFARSQDGNNNAYCQDNATSWVDWDLNPDQQDLLETTRFLLAQRARYAALRTTSFFQGKPLATRSDGVLDLAWYTAEGQPFTDLNWHDPQERCLQMLRWGPSPADAGVLVVVNGSLNESYLTLPPPGPDTGWTLVWDSSWSSPKRSNDDGSARTTSTITPLTIQLYASTDLR